MIITAPPLSVLTITISSLSCRPSRAFCSPFERFEYFGGFICAVSSLISLFVFSINVSVYISESIISYKCIYKCISSFHCTDVITCAIFRL